MIDKIGGRKAFGLILCLAIGVAIVCLKGDITTNLVTLILGLFTGFVAGNSVENVATGMTERAEVQADAHKVVAEMQAAPTGDYQELDQTLVTKMDAVLKSLETNNQGIAFLVDRVMGKK